ncbi:MAG: hypothetical protein HKP27_14070 [Myxococcales bacterium]|nr:hypothetical protein [Myxococcales bacterium]
MAVLAVALLLCVLIVATLREGSGIHCEACVDFAGQSHCATAVAPTREAAEQGAWMSACSVVARGVTRSLECQRKPPRTLRCRE